MMESSMAPPPGRKSTIIPDWDTAYREGTPPWETGRPAAELVRLVDEKLIRPGTTLELGCGTGANAVYLAQHGFEMTAVDNSATAIERARVRAEYEGALLRIVQADVLKFSLGAGPFDLVYDAGFYHFIRRVNLNGFLDMLWRVTRPGSLYLTLAGATGETVEGGPPQVSEREIYDELGRLFEFVELRPCRLESPLRAEGYPGWSCLARRPLLGQTVKEQGS
jgi:SAM-dependent methyltransferase